MTTPTPAEIRQRILLAVFGLGAVAGVGLYVAWEAGNDENVRLLAVLLALALTAIPLARALVRLLRLRRATG